jgi:pimeloyl-ACP methyl ester carboxylesterase
VVASAAAVRRVLAPLIAVLAVGCALPAGAAAAIRDVYVSVKGAPGPGPSKYDKVFVEKIGPKNAKHVLVLVPGYMGGAGDFSLIGRDIVKRVPGLQVWALDRRESAFEDTSVFKRGDPDEAFRYYLNFQPSRGRTFAPVDGAKVPYVRQWGLTLALEDLRRVVLEARAGGKRTVILGGHSLGASTAAAYAAWDFNGRAGYRDIAGIVLIDGGLLGTFSAPSLKQVKAREAALKKGDPFVSLLSGLPPWSAGAFAEVAALYAHRRPYAASVLQTFPLTPKTVVPSFPVTNQAAFGYAFDADTSPAFLSIIQVNSGRLATSGSPRKWVDGGMTPIDRLATMVTHEPGNFVDWYFPAKLTLDVDGANSLARDAITKHLGLRTWHLRAVNRPLYAFETSLTDGRVLRGARRFVQASKITEATYVADPLQSHIDPLSALPSRNRFLQTVVPFLKRIR